MKQFVFKRILQLIPILLGLTLLTFSLLYFSPGDPARRRLSSQGVAVTQETVEEVQHEMGLDRPFLVQYGTWVQGVTRGDLGVSYKDGRPVVEKLGTAFQYTLLLSAASIGLTIAIAVPLGVYTAVRQDRIPDYVIRFMSFVGNSIPNFLLCILLMYFFCIRVKWFPIIAQNSVQGLFLPVLSLSIPLISRLTRQVRAEVLEQLKKDHIAGARIRGVKEGYVLFLNAFRNALSGIMTVIGLSIGTLLGGSVVIETIFSWPGIGKLVMDSIFDRDYPIIQGFVILTAIIYVGINLLIDIGYRYLDPRMEEQ